MTEFEVRILRNGGLFGELTWDADSPPAIMWDSTDDIKSSLRGSYLPHPTIDYLKDELQPVMIVDGREYPLGVFPIATARGEDDGDSTMVAIEAYDRCWLLEQQKTEGIFHISAGSKYLAEIERLLAAAGIVRIISDPSPAVFTTDREDWDIGTSYLSIINTLLSEMGYEDLFFDSDGVANLREYAAPSADNIVRHYSSTDLHRLPMAPGYQIESDVFEAANVFICICSNPDNSGPLIATAVNNSPVSDKSIINRGLRIPYVTKVDQTASREALQIQADRLRDASLMSSISTRIEVPPSGGHLLGDVVSVDCPGIGGIYREMAWQLKLKAGELMTLELNKEVLNADGLNL